MTIKKILSVYQKTSIGIGTLKEIAVKYNFKDVKFDKSLTNRQWAEFNALDPKKCIYLNPNLKYKEFKKHYSYKINPKELFLFVMLHEIGHYVLKHFFKEMSMPFYKKAKNLQDVQRNFIKFHQKQEKEAWLWADKELKKMRSFD